MNIKKLLIIINILLLTPYYVHANGEYREGEVLVKFKRGLPSSKIKDKVSTYNMDIKRQIRGIGTYRLSIPAGKSVADMVSELSNDPDVTYAEPNYLRVAYNTPNDLNANQWGLRNTGQVLSCNSSSLCYGNASGTRGKDINATTGWDAQTGNSSVTIAIIDTGVDLDHPDLANKIVTGYDFVNDDTSPNDDNGHGTHVAGIAAAQTNNSVGIAGVCWGCMIMPVKILNAAGSGSVADEADGITFAVDHDANVINLSIGGSSDSSTEREAMQYAYDHGVVSVCATGNEASPVSFPAAYDGLCIAVAATDNRDEIASFSNFGPEVDIAAPGVDIYSTIVPGTTLSASCKDSNDGTSNNGYAFCSGTSMATPFVSGQAGIILSQYPDYNVDEVAIKISQTAEDVNSAANPGFDEDIGSGRIKLDLASGAQNSSGLDTVDVSIDEKSNMCFISQIGK